MTIHPVSGTDAISSIQQHDLSGSSAPSVDIEPGEVKPRCDPDTIIRTSVPVDRMSAGGTKHIRRYQRPDLPSAHVIYCEPHSADCRIPVPEAYYTPRTWHADKADPGTIRKLIRVIRRREGPGVMNWRTKGHGHSQEGAHARLVLPEFTHRRPVHLLQHLARLAVQAFAKILVGQQQVERLCAAS